MTGKWSEITGIPEKILESDTAGRKKWLAGLTRTWMLLNYIFTNMGKRLRHIDVRSLRRMAKALEIDSSSEKEK